MFFNLTTEVSVISVVNQQILPILPRSDPAYPAFFFAKTSLSSRIFALKN
jgi:hypothetical protein